MPLDPQAKTVLDQMAAMGPPVGELPPEEGRKVSESRPRPPGPPVAKVEDRSIPGPATPIAVRIYYPEGEGPFPALVWFHGGGWVLGNLETADAIARQICVGARCVVVSVDYRLAPEHRFPAALDDCYTATDWTVKNAPLLNVDRRKVAVGGDSAGGNLAAAVPLMARDRGGPPLAFQLLVYGVLDRDFNTRSYTDNAVGHLLTRQSMVNFWNHYLRNDADAKNPYVAPLQAHSLKGLPPALVITAEFDPLRDEGAAYAEGLRKAGVPTTYACYDGMIHGFFGMWHVIDKGKKAVAQACDALHAAFARQAVV